MNQEEHFFCIDTEDKGILRELSDGLTARIFAGDQAMISVVRVEPNKQGAIHSHPEEQWGLCLSGSGQRIQDGEVFDVSTGDFWRTPGGVEHGFRAGPDGAVVYDVFAPIRQDYLSPGTGFGTAETKDA